MTTGLRGRMPQNPPRTPTPTRMPPRGPRPAERPIEAEYRPRTPIDAHRAIALQQRGAHDPAQLQQHGILWRASRTPLGVATLAIRVERTRVRAAAWGAGAEWALDQLPRLCGAADDPEGFDPSPHPLIAEAHRRHPHLRLGRTDLLFDALASAVFEQKVTALQAFGAWRMILTWCGERAPGPTPRPMFAPPADWHLVSSWRWHAAGLEPPQSRTIVAAARRRASIERALDAASAAFDENLDSDDTSALGAARDRVLTSLTGIGGWTSAETRIRAFGDADAVSVGDYHLAHQVGYALTGHRTDDAGMLELLEPWRGHRQRVIRLLALSGVIEPRRGPRLAPEDHRRR